MSENKILVSINDVVSNVAKYGVAQSPYDEGPDDLQVVLKKLCDIIRPYFKDSALGFMEFDDRKSLYNWIKDNLMSIFEFRNWNLSKVEKDKGISFDDLSRPSFVGVSAFDSRIKPDYDFIDLDALIQNVTRDIIRHNDTCNSADCKCEVKVVDQSIPDEHILEH